MVCEVNGAEGQRGLAEFELIVHQYGVRKPAEIHRKLNGLWGQWRVRDCADW
jgi:hypothetical protein